MREREGFPHGVPCWVDTAQPDPQAAVDFYESLFGWEFVQMLADASGSYFVAQLRGRDVAAVGSQQGEPWPPVWTTYIWVDSADGAAAKVNDAGGSTLMEPFDVPERGRMGVFSDPFGAVFCVWEAGKLKGAELVNEPGTWNWSDLNTRDPEGAKSFYGSVFGWEADTGVLEGVGDYTMWRLPGYGEFLEASDPDLRRRQADAGAPTGFADAIGWMMPMTSDQFPDEVQSHWSVTFAVADADAIAVKAAELGGEVLVPPFDAGDARVAVLSDPQGAFTVSKYDPT
jgi:predicted enzyme related to lactoylglutathione lyase